MKLKMRRYEPAMRTVKIVETRPEPRCPPASRAANCCATRVDVERVGRKNQAILPAMDKRSDCSCRLQHTVEGLLGRRPSANYRGVTVGLYAHPPAERSGMQQGPTLDGHLPVPGRGDPRLGSSAPFAATRSNSVKLPAGVGAHKGQCMATPMPIINDSQYGSQRHT